MKLGKGRASVQTLSTSLRRVTSMSPQPINAEKFKPCIFAGVWGCEPSRSVRKSTVPSTLMLDLEGGTWNVKARHMVPCPCRPGIRSSHKHGDGDLALASVSCCCMHPFHAALLAIINHWSISRPLFSMRKTVEMSSQRRILIISRPLEPPRTMTATHPPSFTSIGTYVGPLDLSVECSIRYC
jgi:hypothetical protein